VYRTHGSVHDKYAAARDALGARMPPAQLAEAKRLADEWKAKWPH